MKDSLGVEVIGSQQQLDQQIILDVPESTGQTAPGVCLLNTA